MNSDINPETGVTPTTDTDTALTNPVDTAANPVVNPTTDPITDTATSSLAITPATPVSPAPIPSDTRLEDDSDGDNSALDALPTVAFQYRQVDTMLKEAFNYKESNGSMICDIIAMYLKGQKILYTEAKTLCEQRLNFLPLRKCNIFPQYLSLLIITYSYPQFFITFSPLCFFVFSFVTKY